MTSSDKQSYNNDTLIFAEESKKLSPDNQNYFKLLIVDDENEIHIMTKLVLSDYQYKGAGLEFLSAFSGKEAKAVIKANPDIACCLLDVVMESKDAGLEVARFIREDEKNTKLRIVLRTGQPGKAPEKDIILNYDINDYKEKTELTTQKLFTTITTALRSYIHLKELEEKTKEIQVKNIRLNEEIAKRIVAESNLTKYNRSLEKMVETKSSQLEKAILSLETTEKELNMARKTGIASDISSISLDAFNTSSNVIESNLKKINQYRQKMTLLLDKYNTLEQIMVSQREEAQKKADAARTIKEIGDYKVQVDLDNILKQYPKIIKDSTNGIQQISNTVSDIKLFVSINEEAFQPTNLNLLLEQEVARIKQEFNKKIDVQLDLEKLPDLPLPAKHMGKAIKAVLENAFHAVKSQGIVSVTSKYLDQNIILQISDLGCGIPKDLLPNIFLPYFKGDKTKGKGLGLAFAKSVVLNCNGKIKLTSTYNEGTMVTIVLPQKNEG
jgi:two-component system NtrC family sensor kinase